jgi:hypothetical protein
VACPWRKPEVAIQQAEMMKMFRENSSSVMSSRFSGVMHTFWSDTRIFIDGMNEIDEEAQNDPSVQTFKALVKVW